MLRDDTRSEFHTYRPRKKNKKKVEANIILSNIRKTQEPKHFTITQYIHDMRINITSPNMDLKQLVDNSENCAIVEYHIMKFL